MERLEIRETWEIDSLYPGGLDSSQLADHIREARESLAACEGVIASETTLAVASLTGLIRQIHRIGLLLMNVGSFLDLLLLADVRNERAQALNAQVQELNARHGALLDRLDERLLRLGEHGWQALAEALWQEGSTAGLVSALTLRRQRAAEMLPGEQEAVIKSLAIDGHLGWSEIYHAVNGRTTVTYEYGGKTESIPLAAIDRILFNSPDQGLRETVFRAQIKVREPELPVLAPALNHMVGYRVAVYKLRGWDSVLKEPLMNHRMRQESVTAMFAAVDQNRGLLDQYLARKARLLGDERLRGWDLRAPVTGEAPPWEYPAVAAKVVQYFGLFREDMGQFARTAFAEGHIDTCESQGRQPGLSASSPFPLARSHRIFMNHKTLPFVVAHELGHSYSFLHLADAPLMANWHPLSMVLMEIPSTFAQLLLQKGLANEQVEPAVRLQRVNDLASNAVMEMLARRAAYEFEKAICEARWKGSLTATEITALYSKVQQEVWGEAVSDLNPYGWVNLLFSMANFPFYNFPYTAALLISAGLYARWQEEGEAFASRFPEVVRDLGYLDVEEFGRRHLGVDLTEPEGWQKGIAVLLADLQEFLRLTE